jgi:hypothetical protein
MHKKIRSVPFAYHICLRKHEIYLENYISTRNSNREIKKKNRRIEIEKEAWLFIFLSPINKSTNKTGIKSQCACEATTVMMV